MPGGAHVAGVADQMQVDQPLPAAAAHGPADAKVSDFPPLFRRWRVAPSETQAEAGTARSVPTTEGTRASALTVRGRRERRRAMPGGAHVAGVVDQMQVDQPLPAAAAHGPADAKVSGSPPFPPLACGSGVPERSRGPSVVLGGSLVPSFDRP
jgi:hypothetical protein